MKKWFSVRWTERDYPTAEPRFRVKLFAKDAGIFIFLPALAVFCYRLVAGPSFGIKKPSHPQQQAQQMPRGDGSKSQIIEFHGGNKGGPLAGIVKRSPGSMVRLKLLNVVETYTTVPVHAQIIDAGLGANLIGGTLIGDAVPDANFERITITFRYAKDPLRENIAVPISARALSLDGTLGLVAEKKDGYFTRSVLGSTGSATQSAQGGSSGSSDFRDIIIKALTAGFVQEFGAGVQVEKNRSQVLTLSPATEFFAELTDFFPGRSQ